MEPGHDYQMVLLLQDIAQFLTRKFAFHCDIYEGYTTKRQAERAARSTMREILTGDYAELIPIHRNLNDVDIHYLNKLSSGRITQKENLNLDTVLVFLSVEEGRITGMPVSALRRPLRHLHQPITLVEPETAECYICFDERAGEVFECSRCHKHMCRVCYYLYLSNLQDRQESCPFCRYGIYDHLQATFITPAQAAVMVTTTAWI